MTTHRDNRFWQFYFEVDHVHDGDTIMGTADLGARITKRKSAVRFAGVHAPELTKDGKPNQPGEDVRDYLMTLVKPGDVLRVVSHAWEQHEEYDRFLGDVSTLESISLNESVNQWMWDNQITDTGR